MAGTQPGSPLCFKPYRLEEALLGLAEAGFENVEIGAVKGFLEHLDPDNLGADEIRKCAAALDRPGLRCVSLSGHAQLHTEEGKRRLGSVLEAGKGLGILVLNTFTGDAETPEEVEAFKSNVREIAGRAGAGGSRPS